MGQTTLLQWLLLHQLLRNECLALLSHIQTSFVLICMGTETRKTATLPSQEANQGETLLYCTIGDWASTAFGRSCRVCSPFHAAIISLVGSNAVAPCLEDPVTEPSRMHGWAMYHILHWGIGSACILEAFM